MKKLIASLGVVVLLVSCAHQKGVYTSLYALEHSTTATFTGYLDMVVQGKVQTNDVPKVSQAYDRFQIGMQEAVNVAQFNWTNPAPQSVIGLANDVIAAVLKAKER